MLYDYECIDPRCSHRQEKTYSYKSFPNEITCEMCGSVARKVIVSGHGGIQIDNPVWIDDSVRQALQDSERLELGIEKPIETRTELNAHLNKHGLAHSG